MALSLARALRVERGNCVAFVGAGGKTSAMFELARELAAPVIITTTTHLGAWQVSDVERHTVVQQPAKLDAWEPRGIELVTGPEGQDERLGPVGEEGLLRLHDSATRLRIPLLIEADGAHERPLKAPGGHEPNIPPFTDIVTVVAGLKGLGSPLGDEAVHRPEIFSKLTGLPVGQPITAAALVRLLMHSEGGLKAIPPQARKVALLNQADSNELRAIASSMAEELLAAFDAVIIAGLQRHEVYAVHERVAGIVLAAGGSTRLGRPKPLLDWHGERFVHAVARLAVEARLNPVLVVTGAGAEPVEAAVDELPIRLVRNPEWQSGQASSIRAGLRALPSSTCAAIFLLADQPQVTVDVLRALVDLHSTGLQPIVAPLVMMERRANPVLFDRVTFADLLALEGDVGGRAIFHKHRVEYLPWHDERLLLDVDTEADYRRLVEDDTR